MGFSTVEIIGYLASAVLLVSFTRKNVKHLRIINSVGCILFVVYGFMLESIPVVFTNVAIVIINVYYLFFQKQVEPAVKE